MTASWGYVWRPTATNPSSGCSSSCFNITSADQLSATSSIADTIPYSAGTIAESISYWVDQLSKRIGGRYTITASSEQIYTITFNRDGRIDTLQWSVGAKGAYPLTVTYTTPSDSGTATFQDMNQAIDWHVETLA